MIALKEVDDVTISNEQYRVKSYKLLKKFLLLDFANETFHDKKWIKGAFSWLKAFFAFVRVQNRTETSTFRMPGQNPYQH